MVSTVCFKTSDTMLYIHYCCLYLSKTLETKSVPSCLDHIADATWLKGILISAIENEKSRVRKNSYKQCVRNPRFEIHLQLLGSINK